jgi:hypothetical protein
VDALAWLESNKPDLAVLDTVLKDGPCKEVALRLTSLACPPGLLGPCRGHECSSELASATWVEKPATAQALLQALAGLRASANIRCVLLGRTRTNLLHRSSVCSNYCSP